jgi:hypothetical protein
MIDGKFKGRLLHFKADAEKLGEYVQEGGGDPGFTDRDLGFIIAVCRELLFAWRDSDNRKDLERVMGNVGMDFDDGEWMLTIKEQKYRIGRV